MGRFHTAGFGQVMLALVEYHHLESEVFQSALVKPSYRTFFMDHALGVHVAVAASFLKSIVDMPAHHLPVILSVVILISWQLYGLGMVRHTHTNTHAHPITSQPFQSSVFLKQSFASTLYPTATPSWPGPLQSPSPPSPAQCIFSLTQPLSL